MNRKLLLAVAILTFLPACQKEENLLKDGYYTAESVSYSSGWKEFLTIYVSHGNIVTAEYDAKNPGGFLKSWDMNYRREMNRASGTYPNEYMRKFTASLLARQLSEEIDVVAGATHSHESFRMLADAAIAQSRAGDTSVVYVEVPQAQWD